MRILYGVVGEGMGHAMRSRVVVDYLLSRGHMVEIMASSRAHDFLATHFPEVTDIHGLHIVMDENRVRMGRTLFSNVLKGLAGLPKNIAAYFELIEDFEPQVVISDFESWTYFYAKAHDLPIFSIDNMQVINRCKHPPAILDGHRMDFELARAFVKSKLPFCDHYLITTFFHPPVRKERTTLLPPILRPEIIAATPGQGDHLVVYVKPESFAELGPMLSRCGRECRVYGVRRDLAEEERDGNLRFRPFSETGFVDDLATCAGVVAAAGFTLMGEAVHLHKPMLALPIEGQFEQLMNARYLAHEGFGRAAENTGDPDLVEDFLDVLPDLAAGVAAYPREDNARLFAALDAHLARAAAGAYDN